ncbi:hypothetical protein [Bacillus sp. X1(2014)]|uniref:hypothetical protein n=1 Tax=Bacillus sp. X1(2014) TaxID=1565991 RepID=UPI0011A7C59B|nr:hypothetical protein [Bacillus sp. X1(2014)]
MIHGSISPENIWITTQGRVILYGAGEAKVLEGKPRLGAVSDVRQLIAVIRCFSTLSGPVLEQLNLEEPMTAEELEQILFRAERKAGISEDNKLAAFFERKSITQKAEAAERERRKAEKSKHRRGNKMIIGGVIAAMLFLVVYCLF